MKSELDLDRLARQWGASALPFAHGEPGQWLNTPSTQKALARLQQSAQLRGLMLLSGPNGVGKSALVGRWLRQLDSRLFASLSLTQATLSGSGILATLVNRLGKEAAFRRERNLQLLEAALAELERRTLVVVMDEAQNYSHATLEEIRLLLGLNLPERPTFALILIGDDYLLSTLQLRHHRALYSRLAAQVRLEPWTAQESRTYLEKALQAVGLSPSTIEPAALELLVQAAGGIARSLCLLGQASWIAAAAQPNHKICVDHVQQAIDEVPYSPGLFAAPIPQESPA